MNWFLNLKTSAKLISAFVVVALILAFVGLYGLANLNMMNKNIEEMYNNNLISVQYLSQANYSYQGMRVTIREASFAATKADKDKVAADGQAYIKDIEDRMDVYRKTPLTPEEKDELKNFDTVFPNYKKLFEKTIELAYLDDKTEYHKMKNGEYLTEGTKVLNSLNKLIAINVKLAEKTDHTSAQSYSDTKNTTITVVIIAFVLSILLGYFISKTIANPIKSIAILLSKIADGDIREKSDITTKDEVGQLAASVNIMIDNLQKIIGGMIQSSQSVASASEQISASTEEIAGSSTTQAQSAQTIRELFKELTDAIHSVAANAESAAELSNRTMTAASEGEKVVQASLSGMQEVNRTMTQLEEDSQKIGDIIEVIDDIADQTNLLALNAAIEAARAGDQGRGFAVVADEVRKLAERSSEATKEITAIIKVMQDNTKRSVTAVIDSVAQSSQTGDAFHNIIQLVNDSSKKAIEIAAACEEEAAQAGEVMSSVESIAASSEESAAASEETAAACQSLAQLADELNSSVAFVKL